MVNTAASDIVKEGKKLSKKLKEIGKLEESGEGRSLNEAEQAKIASKDEILQKLEDLSLT